MRMEHASAGAACAGAVLLALPALDLLWNGSALGSAHVITALSGLALAIAAVSGLAGNGESS